MQLNLVLKLINTSQQSSNCIISLFSINTVLNNINMTNSNINTTPLLRFSLSSNIQCLSLGLMKASAAFSQELMMELVCSSLGWMAECL